MTIPHHYSMKWDNYHRHVGDIFSQLLETGSMADVVIYAEGEKINCHKMLLSACSPYFQEILSSAGPSNMIVVVSGIRGEDVRSIIEFIYRGEISVQADRFTSVLKAAEALKICGLMEVSTHLSEMEDSEIIMSNNVEKRKKSYNEDLNHTLSESNLVVNENGKNEDLMMSPSDSSWHCVEMPVENYSVLESNDGNCSVVSNSAGKDIIMADGSIDDSVNQRIDDSKELRGRGINIEHNNEDAFKLKLEPVNINDTPTKMEPVANSEEESVCEDIKLKSRKDIRKKLYSEEAMLAALEDMKSGKNLVEAAAKHHVPRTTLYMRARAIGACPAMVRKGYPREKITAALESVAGGSSLQCAATEFGIPKTVLWRRVQKEIGSSAPHHKRVKSVVASHISPKEAFLQEGVSITRVSPQYQIPKATLFRWEKVHLTGEMKFPKTVVKERPNKQEISPELKLESDISDLESKKVVPQDCLPNKYKVQKSTLWNNIQNGSSGKIGQHAVLLKNENEDMVAVEQLKQQQKQSQHQQSSFSFSEGVHELPVSYVNNSQFSDSSIIILAPVESDKYSVQGRQNEEVTGSVDAEKVLRSIKVENHDNHPGRPNNRSN